MIKKLVQDKDGPKQERLALAKQMLREIYPCFVLVTCSKPEKDGKMQVEMDFEGDEALASMITEHACQVFDERATVPNSNKG